MKKILSFILLIFISLGTSFASFEIDTNLSKTKQDQYKIAVENVYNIFDKNLDILAYTKQISSLEMVLNNIDHLLLKQQSDTNIYVLSYLKYLLNNKLEILKDKGTSVDDNTTSCQLGYILSEGKCVKSITCMKDEHVENNICISDIKNCDIENGKGTQSWENGNWSTCTIAECNSGYSLVEGKCTYGTSATTAIKVAMSNFSPSSSDVYKFTIEAGKSKITLSEITFGVGGNADIGGSTLAIYRDNISYNNEIGSLQIQNGFKNGQIVLNNLNGVATKEVAALDKVNFFVVLSNTTNVVNDDLREFNITGLKYIDTNGSVIDPTNYGAGLPTSSSSYKY